MPVELKGLVSQEKRSTWQYLHFRNNILSAVLENGMQRLKQKAGNNLKSIVGI